MKLEVREYNGQLSPVLPPDLAAAATFLLTDVQGDGKSFLDDIDRVLTGSSAYEETGGNACSLEIHPAETRINCDYSPLECKIATTELRSLIVQWVEARRMWRRP